MLIICILTYISHITLYKSVDVIIYQCNLFLFLNSLLLFPFISFNDLFCIKRKKWYYVMLIFLYLLFFFQIYKMLWELLNTRRDFPGGSVDKDSASMPETWVQSLGWKDSLNKDMATHSSILEWEIPWTELFNFLKTILLRYNLYTIKSTNLCIYSSLVIFSRGSS